MCSTCIAPLEPTKASMESISTIVWTMLATYHLSKQNSLSHLGEGVSVSLISVKAVHLELVAAFTTEHIHAKLRIFIT